MGTVNADTLQARGQISGSWYGSGFVHDPSNDRTFDCDYRRQGWLRASGSISGKMYTGVLGLGTLEAQATISGSGRAGKVFYGGLFIQASIEGFFYNEVAKRHWIGWSKIGDTRLLLDESGDAGFAPLPGDASAWVYNVLAYKQKYPIVYTGAGVYQLDPVSTPFPTFGFKQLSTQGVYCPGAVAGGLDKHFFINKKKRLCVIGDGAAQLITGGAKPEVKELGYYEFINQISPNGELILLHYDQTTDTLYISAKAGGFTLTSSGLGGGYANLTGAAAELFASPSALTQPAQHICTDVLDFNYRGLKTIMQVNIATDLNQDLYVAIDYRYDKKEEFQTSAWLLANREGVVTPIVSGVEFRVRIKTLVPDDFSIDSIQLRFKYTDKRFHRSFFQPASFIK